MTGQDVANRSFGIMKLNSLCFPYELIRNCSSESDKLADRATFKGVTNVVNILPLPVEDNLRGYLPDTEGKKVRRYSQVHWAIWDTLMNNPNDFSTLNRGVTIVARKCELDDKKKIINLFKPSILDGAQTQGVIRDYCDENGYENVTAVVGVTIIVTDDEDLIAEICIARNFQNNVAPLSLVGRRGYLDDLAKWMEECGLAIRVNETDSYDKVDTLRLLRVVMALMPDSVNPKKSKDKVYTYDRKAKCLQEFVDIQKGAKDPKHTNHALLKEAYDYCVGVAPLAWRLYQRWKTNDNDAFSGLYMHKLARENGSIVEVPDGIVFPILVALSPFCQRIPRTGWTIKYPREKLDAQLAKFSKKACNNIASGNPDLMGRDRACYEMVGSVTEMYRWMTEGKEEKE